LPDSNLMIGVTSEKSGTINRPGKRGALRSLALAGGDNLWLELINQILILKIPNLNGRTSSHAEPVFVGREAQSVNNVVVVKGVQVFALGKIPKHGLEVFATRSTERTIGRDSHGVQVTSMANVVGLEFAVGKIPDLDHSVPAGTDNDGIVVGWRESDTGNPVSVSVWLVNGILALSQSVPQLNRLVARTAHNLTVIGRESNRQNIISVALKTTSSLANIQVPQAKSLVPRARESIVTILRENNIRNK